MAKNKKELPEEEEPKKKKRKKKKKKKTEAENQEDFQKAMRDIKDYISDEAKPYAKYINRLKDNFKDNYKGNIFADYAKTQMPKNSKNTMSSGNKVNIPLSLFSELIIEVAKDLIPEDEKEDIFISIENMFLQIDLGKKSILLINNNGL